MSGLFPDLQPIDQADAGSDVAYTPAGVIRALLRAPSPLPPPGAPVWEPCAGGGVWVEELRAAGHVVEGTEIDSKARSIALGLARHGDALQDRPSFPDYEIWTNPPFGIANKLLLDWTTRPRPPRRVVLLVLQQWIVAEERAWIWPLLRRQILLYPRICFEGPGRESGSTDMREYCILDLETQPGTTAALLHRLDWRTGRAS